MEKLKNFVVNNKGALAITASTLLLLGGYQYFRTPNPAVKASKPRNKKVYDINNYQTNITLTHQDAMNRDSMIKEDSVKYEVFLVLSKKD